MEQTRQEYIRDLAIVQDKVYQMGCMAEAAVRKSVQSLLESNANLAAQVMKEDDAIDDMIVDIEDDCILLIAKQQPIAHDLRVIATGFKISTDIERIGDHAFDIARVAKSSGTPLDAEQKKLIQELADCSEKKKKKAMQSYRTANVRLADEVRHMDK